VHRNFRKARPKAAPFSHQGGNGLDILIGTYDHLDLVRKRRDDAELPWTMACVRHHDRYDLDPQQE
jgi:predicted dithiol-disulfide oxidoreductase (DUF899 family)